METYNRLTVLTTFGCLLVHIFGFILFDGYTLECFKVMFSCVTITLLLFILVCRKNIRYIKEIIVIFFAGYAPMAFIDSKKVIFWVDTAILLTPAIIVCVSRSIWLMVFVFIGSLVSRVLLSYV